MIVYIDNDCKCHVSDDGTMTAVETAFFDGKCDTFIEGFRYDPERKMIAPWKPYSELDSAQRVYERKMLAEYEAMINELYSEVTAE